MNESHQSLVLGTAQWGLDYGLTNRAGRVSDVELGDLAVAARRAGIGLLDTAPVYGDSELRIGSVGSEFSVQTKISINGRSSSELHDDFRKSCARLARSIIDGVLIHDWDVADSRSKREAAEFLLAIREKGLARRIGISIYSITELSSFVGLVPNLDVLQAPVSLLDQRLDGEPLIAQLRAQGVVIQARSVLLQGVVASPDSAGVLASHPDVERLRRKLPSNKLERIRVALGYVGSREWIDEIILAASTSVEFDELWSAWIERKALSDWSEFASSDLKLVDPRLWPSVEMLNS